MSFATINFEQPVSGHLRAAPVGFSWTLLFFGFFSPLLRSDWKWAIIMLLGGFVTFGVSWLVFPFIYNKIYVKELVKQGFKVTSIVGADPDIIGEKIGIKLPMLDEI